MGTSRPLGFLTSTPVPAHGGGCKRTRHHNAPGPSVEGEIVASFDGGGIGIENTDPGDERRKKRRETYASLTEKEKKVRRAKARENYNRRKSATKSSITTECVEDLPSSDK